MILIVTFLFPFFALASNVSKFNFPNNLAFSHVKVILGLANCKEISSLIFLIANILTLDPMYSVLW